MYAVDQYAILCVSSLESHRVPDCQRKRMEDTGLAKPRWWWGGYKKKELCPLIALFINTHFVGHFEVLCSPCSRLAQSAVLYWDNISSLKCQKCTRLHCVSGYVPVYNALLCHLHIFWWTAAVMINRKCTETSLRYYCLWKGMLTALSFLNEAQFITRLIYI